MQFSLGNESFALQITEVKEVIAPPVTSPVPFTPGYFLGISNLRGQILSIIDLRSKLNIEPRQNNHESAAIIVDLTFCQMGVIVDSIDSVVQINGDEISAPPKTEDLQRSIFVTGIYKSDGLLTLLLDIKKILNANDISAIKGQLKAS